jgi:DNA-binding beta-propeller fold protein YncE
MIKTKPKIFIVVTFLGWLVMFFNLIAQVSGADNLGNWEIIRVMDAQETPSGILQNVSAIDLDSEGNLYILDSGRNRLLKYSSAGIFIKETGGFGKGPGQFNDPRDLDAHLTLNIFVADFNNNRIVRFDSNLNFLNDFVTNYESPLYFEMPLSVAVNGQYDLFILEDLNKRVVKFDRFNEPLTAFGKASENLGQLLGPNQLAIGNKNEIYVSDPLKKSIQVFDFLGNYLMEIVHPDFIEPRGIFLTPQGQLLVADLKGQKIYFYDGFHKVLEVLDVKNSDIVPLDIASWNPRNDKNEILYVASARLCLVIARK